MTRTYRENPCNENNHLLETNALWASCSDMDIAERQHLSLSAELPRKLEHLKYAREYAQSQASWDKGCTIESSEACFSALRTSVCSFVKSAWMGIEQNWRDMNLLCTKANLPDTIYCNLHHAPLPVYWSDKPYATYSEAIQEFRLLFICQKPWTWLTKAQTWYAQSSINPPSQFSSTPLPLENKQGLEHLPT